MLCKYGWNPLFIVTTHTAEVTGERHDVGNKLGLAKAWMRFALDDSEVGTTFYSPQEPGNSSSSEVLMSPDLKP